MKPPTSGAVDEPRAGEVYVSHSVVPIVHKFSSGFVVFVAGHALDSVVLEPSRARPAPVGHDGVNKTSDDSRIADIG